MEQRLRSSINDGLIKIPGNKYADYNIVKPYKDRGIDLNLPIFVFKNLTKKCYSIRQLGKTVAHAERLCIKNVEFIVNEKGRQRVIRTNHKSVHAFIKGYYTTSGMGTHAGLNNLPVEIYYDPYKVKKFTTRNFVPEFEPKGAMFCIADKEKIKLSYTY